MVLSGRKLEDTKSRLSIDDTTNRESTEDARQFLDLMASKVEERFLKITHAWKFFDADNVR
jgi:hypothetical protein